MIEIGPNSAPITDANGKPFSYPELRGRIRALLRRVHEHRPMPVSHVGALTVDHRARDVRVNGQHVQLAANESSCSKR